VRLVSPIGSDTGGSENLSTSLFNVARLAPHPKFVWVFNANCDGTIIYNNPVHIRLFLFFYLMVLLSFLYFVEGLAVSDSEDINDINDIINEFK
jgi:hypothetical protein